MHCDPTVSVLIDSYGGGLFCKLRVPKQSVHHSLPSLHKCSDARDRGHDYELLK